MSDVIYNWQRFWCPRDSSVNLDNGFIQNPDGKFGSILNPNVKHIKEFTSYQCLVLLGEPGLGKSFEVKRNEDLISAVGQPNLRYLVINLSSYDSIERFERKVFQSKEFEMWLADEATTLYLTLESFDECLIQVESLTGFLLEELKTLPFQRLFLRIVCRTGYWPVILEKGLSDIYLKENIKIIELMPLRRDDVLQAAKEENIDVEKFMDGLFSIGITAFASRPITLKFLIQLFKKTGELPRTQMEMYHQGSLKLCDEFNELRLGKKTAGQLLGKEKMIIAGRVAVVLIFSNNSILWIAPDDADIPDGALAIKEIYGFDELDGQPIVVNQRSLMETLATGLFSDRGQNQMGWAHQTYGEFLAANYLVQHSVDEKRIMDMISQPEGRIIPKLYSVAAWIAVMKSSIFKAIMKKEPEILLLGDITVITEKQKYDLVESYLSRISNLNGIDFEMRDNFRYDRLKHATLSEQIRPYIIDKHANQAVRMEVMLIAEACYLQDLAAILVDIVLDDNESMDIRSIAAFVVSRIAESAERARLKKLIQIDSIDCIDRIKEHVLTAIWPELLTAEELFSILTRLQQKKYLDRYRSFLSEKLIQGLSPRDLPVALQWIIDISEHSQNVSSCFESVEANLLRYAWDNIKIPGVIDLFARIVLQRIKLYKPIIVDSHRQGTFNFNSCDHTDRRILVEKVALMIDPEENGGYELVISNPPLVSADDIEWLFDKINETSNKPIRQRRLWAYLLKWVWKLFGNSADIIDRIYNIYITIPSLTDIFSDSFDAVELVSEKARLAREIYEAEKKYEGKRKIKETVPKLNIDKCIKETVAKLEGDKPNVWWVLLHWMAYKQDGSHSSNIDITTLNGWDVLDDSIRERLPNFAKRYLLTQTPEMKNDLTSFSEADSAAYKALVYLKNHAIELYNLLPISVWEKWAMTIVQYPIWADRDNMATHQKIIQYAYNKVPQEICKYLEVYIDSQNQQHGNLDILDKFEFCQDENLLFFLLEKAKENVCTSNTFSQLLCKLIKWNFNEALIYARELIYESNTDKGLAAASGLLSYGSVSEWDFIWRKILSDVEFGKTFMLKTAHFSEYKKPFTIRLSEIQLEDLYRWLVKNFPHEEDPQHNEGVVFSPTDRDDIGHFRDGVLETLKLRGTSLACDAIERISRDFPELTWIVYYVEKAKKIRAEKKWIPYNCQEILTLVRNNDLRLVKDGEQLLDVVIEALYRIQSKLQGETPLAPLLWDQVVKRPKWENDFSDFIVSQLRDELANRGIILNREVEIRSSRSGMKGERTDIHIDAISNNNSHDVIKVIVEAKGCWHNELTTAMKTQLLDKYLQDNDCKHGIYLVGWFNCPQWSQEDPRRQKAFKNDIDSITRILNDQALAMSGYGCQIRAFILDASLRHQ